MHDQWVTLHIEKQGIAPLHLRAFASVEGTDVFTDGWDSGITTLWNCYIEGSPVAWPGGSWANVFCPPTHDITVCIKWDILTYDQKMTVKKLIEFTGRVAHSREWARRWKMCFKLN